MVSSIDTTAIGIVAGLVATSAYCAIRGVRQKSFDIQAALLIFLAGFTLPGGAQLITAAFTGKPDTLPSSWREYVAVAGIAAIGLSGQYIIQSFRNVWPKRAATSTTNKESSEAGSGVDETAS